MATHRWTVDVDGGDYGGRSESQQGIEEGLPEIIELFNERAISGLFFISTELLEDYPHLIEEIVSEGHRVGSHGHFHETFETRSRREKNADIAASFFQREVPFRAPKFSHRTQSGYSKQEGHTSLLSNMWLGKPIREDTIVYLHPFDIITSWQRPPNLFCKLWYSQPRRAYANLVSLLDRFPSSYIQSEGEVGEGDYDSYD